jgi:tripartite-type tricarboxylate transporter receptor subunit TctC
MTLRDPLASHRPNRRRALAALLAAASAPMAGLAAAATPSFPDRAVKIVVPSVPGGLMDTSARLIGPKLSDYWNVPVIVENRPGAGMAIGTLNVVRSPPDGYTLLLGHEGAVVINPVIVADTPYSVKDLMPLAMVWDTALILIVNKDLPATNLKELDAYVRKNPGKLNNAVADTIGELMSDMVKQAMNWDYVNILYKGNGERIRSVMAGETQMTLASASDAMTALDSGRVRAIGISSLERSPRLPDIPTLDEGGMKGFRLMSWGGLFAPAGTPAPVAALISADARRALAEPDVVERIESGGSMVGSKVTPEQFKERIASDVVRWRGLAERRGMKTYDQ